MNSKKTKSVVVAPQSEPAYIAYEVLKDGGNAFDAAIAGALVQGVVDPHRSGIGGFGAAMLVTKGDFKSHCINYFGRAGSLCTPDMWKKKLIGPAPDGFGYIIEDKENDVGYKSITTPGVLAGFGTIHDRFGKMPWKNLFEGAIYLAKNGFVAGPGLAAFWRRPGLFGRISTQDRLGITKGGAKIWLPDGEPYKAGDKPCQSELAATYEHIAKYGWKDFYSGEIGNIIADDFKNNDALVTENDMREYVGEWVNPVKGEFYGFEIESTPLPGGGVALLQALGLAQNLKIDKLEHNASEYVDELAKIFSAIQNDRSSFQSDPAFSSLDEKQFLNDKYLLSILKNQTSLFSLDPKDTTEIVTADSEGNAIALCHSLGYGSGVYVKDLGFMFNNAMSGFDPVPGNPNSIAAGKARSTAIAQTLVREKGKPKLILGSPGGSHITAGLTQGLINYLCFEMEIQDAVCRPRFDAYARTLLLESRMPYTLENKLSKKWKILRSPSPFGMVGRIYAIAFSDNCLRPGYDPGEPAVALETF